MVKSKSIAIIFRNVNISFFKKCEYLNFISLLLLLFLFSPHLFYYFNSIHFFLFFFFFSTKRIDFSVPSLNTKQMGGYSIVSSQSESKKQKQIQIIVKFDPNILPHHSITKWLHEEAKETNKVQISAGQGTFFFSEKEFQSNFSLFLSFYFLHTHFSC